MKTTQTMMLFICNVDRPFWSGAAGNAVIIEADAFKESDVIYKALSSRGHHDMLQTAELVRPFFHQLASSIHACPLLTDK